MPNKDIPDPNDAAKRAHEDDMAAMSSGDSDGDRSAEDDMGHIAALAAEVLDLADPHGNHVDTLTVTAPEPLDPEAGPLEFSAFLREAGHRLKLKPEDGMDGKRAGMMLSDASMEISQETRALDEPRMQLVARLDEAKNTRWIMNTPGFDPHDLGKRKVLFARTSTGEVFNVTYGLAPMGKKIKDIPVDQREITIGRLKEGKMWDEHHGPEPVDIHLRPGRFFATIPNENMAAPLNDPANPNNWNDRGVANWLNNEILPNLQPEAPKTDE